MLTIGELSKATGANISTIRHYERVGLLSPPARSDGNQRRYREDDKARLSFITRSRDLGLSLDAIRDMLQLASQPPVSGTDADRIIDEQLVVIRTKIGRLRKLEGELERLAKVAADDSRASHRVIDALADDNVTYEG
ncbi:MerR family transcriptional regulator [Rhizobium sp. NIBRBAC000502774]|nr:MerR family transcriptional regulator [Rhizobium sp. NIBRBAC000502774]